eukprot:1157410-Pelagomonas_calceolata.AAC.5
MLRFKRACCVPAVNALTDAIDDHSRALKAALESEEYQALVAEGGSLQFVDLHQPICSVPVRTASFSKHFPTTRSLQMTKDIMATLQESNAVSNVEDACRPCASTAADCTLCESPSSHYYYDLVHPTESVHKLIGEKAVELIEANPRGGRWLSSAPAKDNNGNTVDFDTTLKLTDTISGLKNLINSNQAFTIFMPSSQVSGSVGLGALLGLSVRAYRFTGLTYRSQIKLDNNLSWIPTSFSSVVIQAESPLHTASVESEGGDLA